MPDIGKASYRRGRLYFDAIGWAMVKAAAKRAKKSPHTVVIAALKRGLKLHGKKS
jgi:hypothetical protein